MIRNNETRAGRGRDLDYLSGHHAREFDADRFTRKSKGNL